MQSNFLSCQLSCQQLTQHSSASSAVYSKPLALNVYMAFRTMPNPAGASHVGWLEIWQEGGRGRDMQLTKCLLAVLLALRVQEKAASKRWPWSIPLQFQTAPHARLCDAGKRRKKRNARSRKSAAWTGGHTAAASFTVNHLAS